MQIQSEGTFDFFALVILVNMKEMIKGIQRLIEHHQTISVAESVTAGMIQNYFSQLPHAMDFFEGGITAYNIGQKCTHLFIDPIHAVECNCVSPRVAEEMALGVRQSFSSEWGISITGYCTVVPELNINEPFCWFAISHLENIVLSKKLKPNPSMKPKTIQEYYTDQVVHECFQIWETFSL